MQPKPVYIYGTVLKVQTSPSHISICTMERPAAPAAPAASAAPSSESFVGNPPWFLQTDIEEYAAAGNTEALAIMFLTYSKTMMFCRSQLGTAMNSLLLNSRPVYGGPLFPEGPLFRENNPICMQVTVFDAATKFVTAARRSAYYLETPDA